MNCAPCSPEITLLACKSVCFVLELSETLNCSTETEHGDFTVKSVGQMTLRREVLKHLGIEQGGKFGEDLLLDGCASVRAARPTGSVEVFLGLLAGRTSKVATLEEMDQAAAKGWAGVG